MQYILRNTTVAHESDYQISNSPSSKGRDYAQTTWMELFESLALGRKVILGIDSDIRGSRYMRYKAKVYGLKHIHTALEGCLKEMKDTLETK